MVSSPIFNRFSRLIKPGWKCVDKAGTEIEITKKNEYSFTS